MCRLLTTVLLTVISVSRASGEPTAPDLLPHSCTGYAELRDPSGLIDTACSQPVWHRLQSLDAFQRAMTDPRYLFFQGVVASVEARIGMSWRDAVQTLAGGGLYAGYDPATQGVAVLIRAGDEARRNEVLPRLLELLRSDARSKGDQNPLPETDYRDLPTFGRPRQRIILAGPWIILSNRDELAEAVADAWLDGQRASLTTHTGFVQLQQTRGQADTLWTWLDLASLRTSAAGSELSDGRAENPAAELIAGGILNALATAPCASIALTISQEEVELKAALPLPPDAMDDARSFWFGPQGTGAALPLYRTDATLLSLSVYRDIAEMWLRAGDLFDAATNDAMANAESTLSTLFAGRDFAEDILSSLTPQYRLVAVRQDFSGQLPQPAIRLPAFALIAEMKDPGVAQPEFRRTWQSLIGFLNVVGAQDGNPQLDQAAETIGSASVYSTRFVPEPHEAESISARIHFNFSPSIAFAGSHFILASTRSLAVQIARQLTHGRPDSPAPRRSPLETARANSELQIDLGTLSSILTDNREVLTAQNMISEGHTREEAEQEIALLLFALESLGELHFRLTTTDGQLGMKLSVSTPSVTEHSQQKSAD